MNAPQVVLPPHSDTAEQSVLSALMADVSPEENKAWHIINGQLCAEDFYSDAHRRLFRHMCALLESGRPAELVSLGDAIKAAGELEQCGGQAYFGEIAAAFVSVASVQRHVEIVRQHSVMRQLQAIGNQLLADCAKLGGRTVFEIAQTAADAIKRLAETIAPSGRFSLQDAAEFAEQSHLPWLVKGLLPMQGVAAIFGASGAGKTFLAMDLLGAIGGGRNWFGLRTKRVPILYVCLEGAAGFKIRIKAYRQEFGEMPGFKVLAVPFRLGSATDEADLLKAMKDSGIDGGIVCIDTLGQSIAGSDENSFEDMSKAVEACQRIQAATGGLVLLIHHSGKDEAKGLRGHSSLLGAMDAVLQVSGCRDGAPREWAAIKVKDGDLGVSHPFELERVVLGLDDDDDEISSCIVKPAERAADAVRRVRLPQGGNQRIAWDSIGVLLRDSGPASDAPAECPPGRPVIRLDAAVDAVRTRLTCETRKKIERARQAITGLINRGAIVHRDGFIWLS